MNEKQKAMYSMIFTDEQLSVMLIALLHGISAMNEIDKKESIPIIMSIIEEIHQAFRAGASFE